MKIDICVVLNLHHRKDRKAAMRERLKDVPFPVTYFRSTDSDIEIMNQVMNDHSLSNKSNLSIPALACWLTHFRAWTIVGEVFREIDTEKNNVLILEDDCEFETGWLGHIESIPEPEYWDIIHLGLEKGKGTGSRSVYKPQTEWLAHSYLVNKPTLEKLIKYREIKEAVDHHLFKLQDELSIYDIRPRLTWQDNSKSDIQQ